MLGTCFDFKKRDTSNSAEDTENSEMLCLVNTFILLRKLDIQQRYGITSTGCSKKSSPLKFFAVFSAIAWNFNLEFYTFIC